VKALGTKRRRSMVVALPLLLLCGGACFAHAQEGCDTADTTRLCAAACDPAAEGATPVCRNQVCVDEYWNNQQVAFGTNQVCVEEKLVDCSRNCGFQGTNVVANYAVPDNALDNQWAATPAGHACRAGQALLQGSACELECEPSYASSDVDADADAEAFDNPLDTSTSSNTFEAEPSSTAKSGKRGGGGSDLDGGSEIISKEELLSFEEFRQVRAVFSPSFLISM
jgi:hypothetical protein